jgi:hypothetical protein
MDQRQLFAKACIPNIAAEVENDQLENLRKLAQAHGVRLTLFMPLFTGSEALREVIEVVVQIDRQRDEEGVGQDVRGIHSDDCHGFLTILDNVLTMGESAQGEEGADQPHPHPGSLLEEMGCGDEKSRDSRLCRGVSAVVVGCDCQRGW